MDHRSHLNLGRLIGGAESLLRWAVRMLDAQQPLDARLPAWRAEYDAWQDLVARVFASEEPPPAAPHTPLDELHLSLRTANALRREEIHDVETLTTWTEAQLLDLPEIGTKSIREIKEALGIHDRELKRPPQ